MNCFLRLNCVKNITSVLSNNSILVCHYAARKGTREKMRKKKVKVEVKKVGFIPHNLRDKGQVFHCCIIIIGYWFLVSVLIFICFKVLINDLNKKKSFN